MVDQTKVENIIGYKFSNSDLLTEALEASGRAYTHDTEGGADGNKRLALVGDAILTLIQLDQWYPSSDSRGLRAACFVSVSEGIAMVANWTVVFQRPQIMHERNTHQT
ncbi:hypothetical protein AOL_s00054g905 [Orbilia oligospora ATCC 24927]|uniref:RNase III domain-containing protein n=1 Tax=Arthrobotrys oligospora (strain ATCC 24927 / CBS 115.81 / DSM 1491) TaxID=756982 RepID=G1X7I8_ARTOA|nr:hypothetical protein AOL_s00054g905 [Orbilia oligospora ATCC 24927]EGX50819.1 hypothetical protein AOL_s00054g905 [Orbilia oligospora ATCC 24927]